MSRLLPETFIPFLDSLSFKADGTSAPLVELNDTPVGTASGDRLIKSSVCLYQQTATHLTLVGFRQKLQHLLCEANHVANDSVVDAILGCTVGAASSGSNRAAFLDNALAQCRKAEVSHFFVLPNAAITKPVHFDGYRLGEIDISVLKSRCNRAHSDYVQLYGDQLEGRFALQTPVFNHVIMDFLKLGSDSGLYANSKAWRDLLLNYFERISQQYFDFMWAHLDRTQVLSAPFNAHFLDVQNLRNEMGKLAQRVTIYLELSSTGGGYVLPQGYGLNLNQPGPESESFARFAEHRRTYRLTEVGDSELGRILLVCAGFCQQAIRFLESERADDAALYSTICLEHLFSEKTSTSGAVCTRTAALTYLRLAASYTEAERELRKLYDARSAFVHSGKSVTAAQAERLLAYARETLRSLLVLHFKTENRASGFLKKWVKDLDFIVSGFEAGRTFEDALLAECGIFRS